MELTALLPSRMTRTQGRKGRSGRRVLRLQMVGPGQIHWARLSEWQELYKADV